MKLYKVVKLWWVLLCVHVTLTYLFVSHSYGNEVLLNSIIKTYSISVVVLYIFYALFNHSRLVMPIVGQLYGRVIVFTVICFINIFAATQLDATMFKVISSILLLCTIVVIYNGSKLLDKPFIHSK